MRCAVCNLSIPAGQARFANDFERIRAMFPCCGAACAQAFNPDQHWIPSTRPAPLDDDDQGRLLQVLRQRLNGGDRPSVLVREMLAAGVSPRHIRLQLGEASTAGAASQARAVKASIWSGLVGLLTGWAVFHDSRDKRDPQAIDAAIATLAEWERAFPSSAPM